MYIDLHVKYPLCLSILKKPGLSEHVFEEYSKIKFHENPSNGSELFRAGGRTDGRTDRYDGANSRFILFRECT